MRDSEAGFEEVATSDLTHGPAEESGTVIANLAVLVGWLVPGWAVAGPAAPGVGRARGGEGFLKDLGPDVASAIVLVFRDGGFDAALYVIASRAGPGLGAVSAWNGMLGGGEGYCTGPEPVWKVPPEQPSWEVLRQKPVPVETVQGISTQHCMSSGSFGQNGCG
jgi:hypothetical protein